MALAISTFSSSGTGTNARMRSGPTGSTGTLTLSNFQNTGASDTLLIVQIAFSDSSTFIGTMTVTYGSQTMTQIGTIFSYNASSACILTFGLVNPTSGLHNLVITWTGGAGGDVYSAYGISFTGSVSTSVSAATYAYTTNSGTSTTSTVTSSVAISSGDIACAIHNAGTTTAFTSTNGTTIDLDSSQIGSFAWVSACNETSGAGSTITLTGTGFGSNPWGSALVGIKAATGGGPPPGVQNNDLVFQGLVWARKYPDGYGVRYRSWEESGNALTPTIKTTFGGNYPWPNPVGYPRPNYFWSEGIQPAIPFNQDYWPNPQPIVWYQSWIESGNALEAPTQAPFSQTDWPNPQRITWYQSWTQQSANLPIPTPGNISVYDWHLAPSPQQLIQTWIFTPTLLLTSVPQNPFFQTNWPNPYPVYWYRDYNFNNIEVISNQPASLFNNYDWSNWPQRGNPRPDEFYFFNNIEVISNQPASFFNNYDQPNPKVLQWYRDWYQALALYLPVVFPFRQTDWPNPRTYPPIDQFWADNINLLPQPNLTQPFAQYDWPNPRDYQRIDESFWQDIINLFPPPPPPPAPTASGKTWTREEWTKKLTQYVQQRQPSVIPELSAHFAKLGKLSGIARNAQPFKNK